MNTYNQVCSFGPFCHTGNLLQRLNIKIVSFPFDWLCTTPLIISDCIENNFRYFLDKSYYLLDENDNHQVHKYYADHLNSNTVLFAHSNPLQPTVYEYLERCIKRFDILLHCSDKKLFIISYMVTYTETVDSDYMAKVKILNETLSKKTTNYDILCIINNPNQSAQSFSFDKMDNNIFILQLNTFSISHGVFFLNENDNLFLQNIINSHFLFEIKNIYDFVKPDPN
jgi:hypothetical protein